MSIRTHKFRLVGSTPLLMHSDDFLEADRLKEWRMDPDNKNVSVPGDDRSPPWTWQTYLHHDGEFVAAPHEWIMAALRYAGARVPLKGQTTFKSISQSGIGVSSTFLTLLVSGRQVRMDAIESFADEPFSVHVDRCKKLGFKLSIKRAKIGKARHVRVRPMFEDWEVRGEVKVLDDLVTKPVIVKMFDIAGRLSGLGDWRPSSKESPGPYGTFQAFID